MGHICPVCQTYQPQVKVHTLDEKPPKKPEDIFAIDLACGHTVGGEEYQQFLKLRAEILKDAAGKKLALENETKAKLAAAWKSTVGKAGE
jgi:hypothetical protein